MAITEAERHFWHHAADRVRKTNRTELDAFVGNIDLSDDERAFVARLANEGDHGTFMTLVTKIVDAPV